MKKHAYYRPYRIDGEPVPEHASEHGTVRFNTRNRYRTPPSEDAYLNMSDEETLQLVREMLPKLVRLTAGAISLLESMQTNGGVRQAGPEDCPSSLDVKVGGTD